MKTLLIAIHGILTRQTDPSWPDRFDAWCAAHRPDIRVLKKEYAAGPFPRWNCWFKNPRLARAVSNEVRLMLDASNSVGETPAVWIVSHSNGALIAIATARLLANAGHTVAGLILIGAACPANPSRNGVLALLEAGQLGTAIAYCSRDDAALPGCYARRGRLLSQVYSWLAWPYGALGRTGWEANRVRGCLVRRRFITRWFPGGHSGYFARDRIEFTFRQVIHDVETSLDPAQPVRPGRAEKIVSQSAS